MIAVEIASARRIALEVLADVVEPTPPIDFEKWAVNNIIFGEGEGDFPGPYNPALFPFWTEVLKALSPDDPCRTVTLVKSAQIGGTILGNVFVLGGLDLDPGPCGVVHPTELNGAAWSRQKLAPMIRGNAHLAELFAEAGKEGGNAILYKERADGRGFVQVAGANSPSALSMRTWRRIVMDDLSKWELNAAGDPENQAETRAQGIEFAKIFKVSTPLIEDSCRISRNYVLGSRESYHVPCPHCRTLQSLEWENFEQTTGEDGTPEDAGFACIECGGLIEERHRAWMIDPANGARWIAENPEAIARHRSFRIWSAYAPLMSWPRAWEDWLARKGSPAQEQVFINDIAGQVYRGDSDMPPSKALQERAASGVSRGTIPAGHPLLFCGVDVQEDRVEWQIVAFGPPLKRAVVEKGVIPLPITDERCRQQLDDLLHRATWPNQAGRRIGIDRMAIDGNYDTPAVFSWMRRHPKSKVLMIRGVAGRKPMVLQKVGETSVTTGKKKKWGGRFFNLAVDGLKLDWYRCLKIEDPDAPAYVSLPCGYGEDDIEQLIAETRTPVRNRAGQIDIRWKVRTGGRNEGLDTTIYASAASINWGIGSLTDADWARLIAERDTAPDDPQLDLESQPPVKAEPETEPSPPAPTKRKSRRRTGGFVKSNR